MVRYPGRAAFVALVIWFVVAIHRYFLTPRALENFGPIGGALLTWVVTVLIAFAGAFYYLLAQTPNPPMAAARFGVYAVVLKGLFDLGIASAVHDQIGPSTQELLASPAYGLEMVLVIVSAYLAGQFFVRARRL